MENSYHFSSSYERIKVDLLQGFIHTFEVIKAAQKLQNPKVTLPMGVISSDFFSAVAPIQRHLGHFTCFKVALYWDAVYRAVRNN